ncbi:MAG TPA: DUF2239 family protein [Vicinamibacterales bacterium]|nr:DUF2239 family protein [Vicinamibacterales bacterium]
MTYTAFAEFRRIASGSATEVVAVLRDRPQGEVLVFDDATGSQVDLDIRGIQEGPANPSPDAAPAERRGRGRPRLGVVAKEVTLLPRHWDWLNAQPGGASVALRRLVDEARRTSGDRDRVRAAQEAAYRFTSAVAGNLPGFEEATRALFAYDRRRFAELVAAWPAEVRDYAVRLAFADHEPDAT